MARRPDPAAHVFLWSRVRDDVHDYYMTFVHFDFATMKFSIGWRRRDGAKLPLFHQAFGLLLPSA